VIADVFDALVAASLVASVAICLVLALRLVARRFLGAETAYFLWIVVPLAVIAAFLPAPHIAPVVFAHGSASATIAATLAAPIAESAFDVRNALLGLWLAGALAMLMRFIAQQRRYLRTLGALAVSSDARIVRAASEAVSPALVGALRPRIVLPADFESRYAPRERALVLAHEVAHRERGDAQANAIVAFARCIGWFNPLVHIAAAAFRFDQELACDASVIRRFPEARRPYADAMLKTQLAEQSRQELRLPVGCRWPSGHPLKERIHMLKKPMPTRAKRTLGAAVAACVAIGGGYASWSMQPARATALADATTQAIDPSEIQSFRTIIAPRYPATAIASHVSGDVVLRVHVNAKGEPESAEIASLEPADAAKLGDAAIATVMKWRFNPALRDGVAVAGDVEVPVTFRLSDDDDSGGAAPEPPLPPPPAPPPPPWPDLPADAAHTSYRKLLPPAYPKSSVDAKIEGVVYVDAAIDATGTVTGARVDHVEPPIAIVLGDAATDAVKKWSFNPPMQLGKAVAAHAIVPMRFAIHDPDAVALTEIPAGALDIIDVVADPPENADAR
jgi:TonB family protein